ncbi:hypothetical protein ACIPPS_31820 [Streptomyces sp. NPDC090127]
MLGRPFLVPVCLAIGLLELVQPVRVTAGLDEEIPELPVPDDS